MTELEVGVGELVGLINQTFEYAYPTITVVGELANLRVSKGKWLYFDLKDETCSVKFFGTVYQLPGPLEDGMMLKVRAQPRLHNLYGFSMNVQSIQPAGEGSIRKAAELLFAQLQAEGLFEAVRKRRLPYPPQRIGLVTSRQSAAYADFVKILRARWGGIDIQLIDVQVQGEPAPAQIVAAIEQFNEEAVPPDVLVVIRGGGSAEDLAAFNTEQVTRAVAASRVPTLVAIGHEVDSSLAELAADQRASTPSNAAELLTPDRQHQQANLREIRKQLDYYLSQLVKGQQTGLQQQVKDLERSWQRLMSDRRRQLAQQTQLLTAYNPETALRRGYAVIRHESQLVTSVADICPEQALTLQLADGTIDGVVQKVTPKPQTGTI